VEGRLVEAAMFGGFGGMLGLFVPGLLLVIYLCVIGYFAWVLWRSTTALERIASAVERIGMAPPRGA
jgi:hypothetical protein